MSETLRSTVVSLTDAPYPSRAVAWYATAILAFMFWMSILDRFIISLLVTPLKRDMGITDTQFGLLNGTAFIVTFALLGLALGALADHFNRRWLIFLGVSVWSLATAACGVTHNFAQLFLARIGLGAGEAALNPCATSMLADFFPRGRLTLATAMYAIGGTVGAGMAFLVGGTIIHWCRVLRWSHIPHRRCSILAGGLHHHWPTGPCFGAADLQVSEPARRGKTFVGSVGAVVAGRLRRAAEFHELSMRRFFFWHYWASPLPRPCRRLSSAGIRRTWAAFSVGAPAASASRWVSRSWSPG